MRDLGFTPRTLDLSRVPAEIRRVFLDGMRYGLAHRVMRPVMLATLVNMSFLIFGFYSWQPYFLELLGKDLVWVAGAIASALALAMMAGNALVGPLSRRVPTRTGLLMGAMVVQSGLIVLCGMLDGFATVVGLYLLYGVAVGVASPVKQAYLNAHIPSDRRATLISLDSLFASLGGAAGQGGWGLLARSRSIAEAWTWAGVSLLATVPLYWMARKADGRLDSFREGEAREAVAPNAAT